MKPKQPFPDLKPKIPATARRDPKPGMTALRMTALQADAERQIAQLGLRLIDAQQTIATRTAERDEARADANAWMQKAGELNVTADAAILECWRLRITSERNNVNEAKKILDST